MPRAKACMTGNLAVRCGFEFLLWETGRAATKQIPRQNKTDTRIQAVMSPITMSHIQAPFVPDGPCRFLSCKP
jgi:hypothetical protein